VVIALRSAVMDSGSILVMNKWSLGSQSLPLVLERGGLSTSSSRSKGWGPSAQIKGMEFCFLLPDLLLVYSMVSFAV